MTTRTQSTPDTDKTPEPVHLIREVPLDEIDMRAMPRDRTVTDPEAMDELRASIRADGLHQPIELFEIEMDERFTRPYALISGHRRLSVFHELGRPTIPAFIRRVDFLGAMTAMVTENEIRAQISPWEKAMLVTGCLERGIYPNADAAIEALYPALSRQKRSRLRGHVMVAQEFQYSLATPERLTVSRLDRLAAALRAGWDELIRHALPDRRTHNCESQWQAILPVLTEALSPTALQPAPSSPGDPRRLRHLRTGLTVRRELTRSGWILRFTGPQAKSPGIIDDVMDEVERIFTPE